MVVLTHIIFLFFSRDTEVRLKKLIIQGFKSFKDRTVITFDKGITGIVGPNGCGKSNIVDALFWVMGEQSAKHLRGDNMKDVIFSGTSKFGPGAWAEVTLVLDNPDGKHIHIGNKVSNPTEIQVTRKLYRNGETEYRINGVPCRLKDIQEVFMDTGAGAKSYSIIAQGEINRLVQAKPVERRVMIEEVAGITKFKARKKESLKKIEQTELNLGRLNDLEMEVEKTLNVLEKQAEKAALAQTLKANIEKLELLVGAHKELELVKGIKEAQEIVEEKSSELVAWTAKKDSLELSLQEERIKRDEMTSSLDVMQASFNEQSKRLATLEERLTHLKRSKEDRKKLILTRQEENQQLQDELSDRKDRLVSLESELESVTKENDSNFDFSELEDKVEVLKTELDFKRETLSDLKSELEKEKNKLQSIDQENYKTSARKEELAAQLQDITQEIDGLEKQYAGVNLEIANMREDVLATEKSEALLKESEFKAKEAMLSCERVYQEKQKLILEKNKELIQVESRLKSLSELRDSLEGIEKNTSQFLKDEIGRDYVLLGNLIKCAPEYTSAVGTLMGELLEVLVSSKEQDLRRVFSWTEKQKNAGLDILLDSTSKKQSTELDKEFIPLLEIVELPNDLKEKISPLLFGMYICKNFDSFTPEKLKDKDFCLIASSDGKQFVKNIGGAFVLGFYNKTSADSGMVARNNKISELTAGYELIAKEVSEIEQVLILAKSEYDLKKNEYEKVRSELSDMRAVFAHKKSTLDNKLSTFETAFSRLEILKNRKNETSKQRLDILEKSDRLQKQSDELKSLVEDKSLRLEEVTESYEIQNDQYLDARNELTQKQVAARTYGDRLRSLESQVEDVKKQVERLANKIRANEELIDQYQTEIGDFSSEISQLEDDNKLLADELSAKEKTLSVRKDELAELLIGMQSREEEVKTLESNINKNDKKIVEFQVRLEQYLADEEFEAKNIFEKYHVDLRSAIVSEMGGDFSFVAKLKDLSSVYFKETELGKEEIAKKEYVFQKLSSRELKEKESKLGIHKAEYANLGEINWQAIEDYERQKKRYDFLKVQEKELRTSLEDLQNAIIHIDEKSKNRFQVAFTEVSERFQKVFPIIFGGGYAELKMVGDQNNDDEFGVDIIARPPGKNMQNINLMSGGEKALTAVSLIFSIFLVKPSPFCLLDEVDAPLDDANVGRFNELLREMSQDSQFILITHNKKTMEMNDTLYGVTMQESGVSRAVSVQLH